MLGFRRSFCFGRRWFRLGFGFGFGFWFGSNIIIIIITNNNTKRLDGCGNISKIRLLRGLGDQSFAKGVSDLLVVVVAIIIVIIIIIVRHDERNLADSTTGRTPNFAGQDDDTIRFHDLVRMSTPYQPMLQNDNIPRRPAKHVQMLVKLDMFKYLPVVE